MTTESQTMARAEALLQRMAQENAQLRADNRRLRKLKVNAGRGRILSRAFHDATVMLAWRFAGYAISRSKCVKLGVTDRRWEWARALMIAARIHDGADVTETDFDAALRKLATTHDRIEAQGDIGALVLRRRKREPMTAPKAATVAAPKAA